jgi:hypothetical protein
MYVPIRAILVPRWSACASALSGFHRLSDEFFAGPQLTKSPVNFQGGHSTKQWILAHISLSSSLAPGSTSYVSIRAILVPRWSACASALSGFHRLSDEFFAGPQLTKSLVSFRVVLQPSNGYLHTFHCHQVLHQDRRHHPTSEYHDTPHCPEYVTIHGGSPCVLSTMHLAFDMDKTDNTLVRSGVQGQTCHIPVVIRCVSLPPYRTGSVEFRVYYQTNHNQRRLL